MKIGIKLIRPEKIPLDRLLEIQEQSFDKTYLEECKELLKEDFYESSYAIALDNNKIIAYYQYQTPSDKAFEKYKKVINNLLRYRESILSGKNDLKELIECCRNSSGLPVDQYNNDIHAFSGEVVYDESKWIFSSEIAVLPEYRGRGITTKLIKKVKDKTNGLMFALNRKDSAMQRLNKKLGGLFLLQFGPVFKDGSSLVLSVK